MIHGIRDFPAMTSSVSSILTSIRMGKRRQKWETFKTFGEANTRKIEIEYSQQVGNFVIPNLPRFLKLMKEYVSLLRKQNGRRPYTPAIPG